uniref:Preprotein translocase subunit seca (ATPase, RNA helicase) n=1 Tax=uncultured alpha proteobacterium EB000_46D07 TaxID=710793 RepID=E0XZM4_9PROT|nr:preprotein translocase subunit seca (ATPase, RNA helicase) [uncultured alpha proteobacterium EB000_46D07]
MGRLMWWIRMEFRFDYLRDHLDFDLEDKGHRDWCYAIVDEVDSVLIDEARTPLIISGPAETNAEHYSVAYLIVPLLVDEDFDLDEKGNSVSLIEIGLEHAETLLRELGAIGDATLYDIGKVSLVRRVYQGAPCAPAFCPRLTLYAETLARLSSLMNLLAAPWKAAAFLMGCIKQLRRRTVFEM